MTMATSLRPAARRATQCLRLDTRRRTFASTVSRDADFTHIVRLAPVIGAGVVGLATARHLTATHPSSTTLLVERHAHPGTETSSRNSEVIHAGLYYGRATLKTALCTRGRRLLYAFCAAHGVAHRRTGKWLVAQNDAQRAALERIYASVADAGPLDGDGDDAPPLHWVAEAEARRLEPAVRARAGVLASPETGIVDAHGLMVALRGLFEDEGGTVAVQSRVEAVEALQRAGAGGWAVTVVDAATGESSTVTADVVVNAAGLGAVDVHNMIVPAERQMAMFYAKGNYFSYSGGSSSSLKVNRLIYPAPEPGVGGLGTHLTLDLGGRIRFGPDVEWVEDPSDVAPNAARLDEAVKAIREYLPGLDADALAPDYAGIRPKLLPTGAFHDFVVRKEDGFEGLALLYK
ncbi:L-2-hydroxyglutarate dehydrogenase like protein [Verticillium longisporum]|uniref:L-2-hydroxyglutarate dehydrogenase, mitochondrial n=1 Tax=Verticillium longisporum TaxID=100787 RepID=A0A8I2ZJG0_VERLO|nr:L-2-hydroxyglutarate dehydrogenase like protein [Verticillium longisporum]